MNVISGGTTEEEEEEEVGQEGNRLFQPCNQGTWWLRAENMRAAFKSAAWL